MKSSDPPPFRPAASRGSHSGPATVYGSPASALSSHDSAERTTGGISGFIEHIDLPSFSAGAACALAVVVVLLSGLRLGRPLLKIAMSAVLLGLLGSAYLGWVRHSAGLGETGLTSPKELIDDAKGAVDKLNARVREQEKMIHDLQNEH